MCRVLEAMGHAHDSERNFKSSIVMFLYLAFVRWFFLAQGDAMLLYIYKFAAQDQEGQDDNKSEIT